MKLQPSKIHFSQELLFHYTAKVSVSSLCPIRTKHCVSNCPLNNLPKLQVFKKGDCYFALDNNCLTFYRRLELTGHLGDKPVVEVDVVSTKKIPKHILNSSECSSAEDSTTSESDFSDTDSDSLYDFRETNENLTSPKTFGEKLKKVQEYWNAKVF